MHRTPQANQDLPAHQPPAHDDNIPIDIEEDTEEPNHPPNPERVEKENITYHPLINDTVPWAVFIHANLADSYLGLPCDAHGIFLPEGAPPPPWEEHADDDFATFKDAAAFELADLLFRRDQMSGTNINDLL